VPVLIGGKPQSNFTDPIGLLEDCHRRVEQFLAILVRVSAGAQGGALGDEQRTALDKALRYFRESAPKHTADEEESLFPRLRAIGTPEAREVLLQVEQLQADHVRAAVAHDTVETLGQRWLKAGNLSKHDASLFAEAVASLADLYRGHIALEDREVFPAASRLLDGESRRAIGEEMAARRGLPFNSRV
jgi:hemerythrin-like domain-containing protein